MENPERETAFRWEGPPLIEVERFPVEHNGTSWLQHRLVLQGGRSGVVVVATSGASVAMLEHWRPVVDRTLLELPRGMGDPSDFDGRSPEEGALVAGRREFEEETGSALVDPALAGHLFPDTGILGNEVFVVTGTIGGEVGGRDHEANRVELVPRSELRSLVAAGRIADGISLAALGIAGLL